jgi:hypothetical protein
MVHACNPSYLRNGDRKIVIRGQPLKKLMRPYLSNKLGTVVCACGPSYSGGRGWKIVVQDQPQAKSKTYLKDKRKAKGLKAWLKLWSKNKVLNLIPSTTNQTNK